LADQNSKSYKKSHHILQLQTTTSFKMIHIWMVQWVIYCQSCLWFHQILFPLFLALLYSRSHNLS